MSDLTRVLAAALELQGFCDLHHYRFCFIGGLALQRWGEPRMTVDADVSLLTGFGDEEPFVDALLGAFKPSREQARAIALHDRVLFIQASNEVHLDIALAAIPFEERAIGRATLWTPRSDISLRTCSAEDLIVHKAFADRGKDWLDIEGILIRQGARLSLAQIADELRPLIEAKERPDIELRLKQLAKKHGVV
jgi:hypothetical protein